MNTVLILLCVYALISNCALPDQALHCSCASDLPVDRACVMQSVNMSSVLISSTMTLLHDPVSCVEVTFEDISTEDIMSDIVTKALPMGESAFCI